MRIRNILVALLILFIFNISAKADEGMWIPSLLKHNIKDMQKKGFRLTAEDLYSINQASMKDAIANIGGCTAEIISAEGLLLTNHHCGMGKIQYHSSVENDYLKNGFWAANKAEELPNPGFTAKIMVRIDDITSDILGNINEDITPEERIKQIDSIKKFVVKKYTDMDNSYEYSVSEMFNGNVYMMFVYEVFKDVRLVGAPPSSIGKFGGEEDNWMWPRHTGDFCLFRIYAGADNRPAEYSKDNVPYKPKKYFKISLDGVEQNDFTFIYGYPGRTMEYVPSFAITNVLESNPQKIAYRDIRLNLMKEFMDQSDQVRIQYAAKRAGVANAWKKWQGESMGLERLDAIGKKEKYEQQFVKWVTDNKKEKYKHIMPEFKVLYTQLKAYEQDANFYREAFMAIEIFNPVSKINTLVKAYEKDKNYKNPTLKSSLEQFYKDYYIPYDIKLFKTILKDKVADSIYNNIDNLYATSIFADSATVYDLINLDDEKFKKIQADGFYILYTTVTNKYIKGTQSVTTRINNRLAELQRDYMAAMMEMEPNRNFYPDANSTLRVAYGKVDGFKPRDGIIYEHYTTLDGIIEKNKTGNPDYEIPEKLKTLWENKDYGRYTGKDGKVPVAFIATNHTTGGNSGSPLLNAKGELIGINFDRCWESTMSDYMFDPDYCRNISVDIRYVLFIIDKYAGASNIIKEIGIK